MKKRNSSTGPKSRTVVRSSKTGRFVKSSAAKLRPDVSLIETVMLKEPVEVEVARSTRTGRFVRKTTADRNPRAAVRERVKR